MLRVLAVTLLLGTSVAHADVAPERTGGCRCGAVDLAAGLVALGALALPRRRSNSR